jgi:hypothetical protein
LRRRQKKAARKIMSCLKDAKPEIIDYERCSVEVIKI